MKEAASNNQLKSFLRPAGSGTPTKHLRSNCESQFDPRRLRGLTGCYASVRMAVAAFVFLFSLPTFASETPIKRVTAYIAAFNSGADMQVVGAEYWFSEMVLNPADQHPVHLSGAALAQQFERLRAGLKEAGWVRSEIVETANCQLREDFALVSVRYVRIFEDGARRPGSVLYTVGKDSSIWKISSINPVDPTKMIGCSGDDA